MKITGNVTWNLKCIEELRDQWKRFKRAEENFNAGSFVASSEIQNLFEKCKMI